MYKLEFTLKQHTPIIHFQYDQDGATLRATEVKPKLDRFLIEKFGRDILQGEKPNATRNDCYSRGLGMAQQNGWLIKDKEALDYKLNISPVNQSREEIPNRYPLYFGNTNKPENEQKHFTNSNSLKCLIITHNNVLESHLEKNIIPFFSINNFGSRQNKGFGSFSVIQINEIAKSWSNSNLPVNTPYFEVNSIDKKIVFEVIDYYWKRLKSGINYTYDRPNNFCLADGYEKSYLYKYLLSGGFTWEKRWIKESFFSLIRNGKNPKFARGIMGLPNSFKYTEETCNPDDNEYNRNQVNLTITIKNLDKVIERIPSPFVFKPIKKRSSYDVYVLVNDFHIKEIYSNPFYNKLDFRFYVHEEINLDYRIGQNRYNDRFPPGTDLTNGQLKMHFDRLNANVRIPALQRKFEKLQKQIGFILPLPIASIDFHDLLLQYNIKELANSFTPIRMETEFNKTRRCRELILVNVVNNVLIKTTCP